MDTHVLLWILHGSRSLSAKAAEVFLDMNNEVYVSAVSYWEICLKVSLQKLKLVSNWYKIIQKKMEKERILWLPIQREHMEAIIDLPWIHRDPFDRLLIAQVKVEDLDRKSVV